jgi:hypothetical protein
MCHEQEVKGLAMDGKNLLEFSNKFHNFRSYIQICMDFYRLKLDLARLMFKGPP